MDFVDNVLRTCLAWLSLDQIFKPPATRSTSPLGRLRGNYKCPRSFAFRTDPLPLSGAGKIQKSELRREYWAGTDRGVS
jgi:acyl-CoA synthetase (AMP-forming)/AMP-acid ligase II